MLSPQIESTELLDCDVSFDKSFLSQFSTNLFSYVSLPINLYDDSCFLPYDSNSLKLDPAKHHLA